MNAQGVEMLDGCPTVLVLLDACRPWAGETNPGEDHVPNPDSQVNIIEKGDAILTDHVVRWKVRLGKDKNRISEQAIVINRLKNRSNRPSPRKLDLIVSSGSELLNKAA